MSFQKIIDGWRRRGRVAHADHVSIALATFKISYGQVFINLDTDRLITQATRAALLKQLLTSVADDGAIVEQRILSFCQAHQCNGRTQPTAQRASLGHVEERTKTERTLASAAIPTSGFTRRRRSPALVIDMILRRTLAEQCKLLAGIPLSKFEMWSFYQSRALDDPFRNISKQTYELVRRLGLGKTDPSNELLLWAHGLRPEQTAHVPTAFDAALYSYFRPGGKTHPLSGTGALREVVHSPVTGDQLTHALQKAL